MILILMFTYVYVSWESSTNVSCILFHAIQHNPYFPPGMSLASPGYTLPILSYMHKQLVRTIGIVKQGSIIWSILDTRTTLAFWLYTMANITTLTSSTMVPSDTTRQGSFSTIGTCSYETTLRDASAC